MSCYTDPDTGKPAYHYRDRPARKRTLQPARNITNSAIAEKGIDSIATGAKVCLSQTRWANRREQEISAQCRPDEYPPYGEPKTGDRK